METELLDVDERRLLKGKVSASSWSVPCVHVDAGASRDAFAGAARGAFEG